MKFAAFLAAITLIPLAGVAGYFAHQDPPVPGFGEYVVSELGLKHVPGQDSDDWLAAVVTGPQKGATAAATDVMAVFPTQAAVEKSAGGKVKYYEVRCKNYSTGGDKELMFVARSVLRKCSASEKTRNQVKAYAKRQIQG